jgi:4-amino-4-deoxy-L-arabinose transferase-like glycosyltransferase
MSRNKIIIILFLLAILSGVFWSHKMFGGPIQGDAGLYNNLAKNILEHSGFASDNSGIMNSGIMAMVEPFYSIFLAGAYYLFGLENFDAVRIIQIFLFALTVILVCLLVEKLFERKYAVASGILVSLFFPLAASAGLLNKELLFTFFVVLLIWLLYNARQTMKIKWFVFAGIILGLAVLTNAILQFFIVFIIFYFFFSFKKDIPWKNLAGKLSLLLLFFLIVVGCWSLRSYFSNGGVKSLNLKSGGTLSRRVEMMESIKGEKYFRHLGGQLFGYYFFEKQDFQPSEFLGHPKAAKRLEEMIGQGYGIEEINRILTEENFRTILNNIPQYFAISILDFLQFNGPMLPNPRDLTQAPMQNLFTGGSHPEIPGFLKVEILLALRILYWFFFGFVIYGFTKSFKDWRKFGLIILIVLYFNLVHAALFGIPRYAIPIYPFYIIFFVYGIHKIFENYL